MEALIDFIKIQRIAGATKSEFNEKFGFKSCPVLITDIMDNWRAKQTWTTEFFEDEVGHFKELGVRVNDDSDKRQFSIREYFTYMRDCHDLYPYYLKNCQFHLNTAMQNDYAVPDYFKSCLAVMAGRLPTKFQLSWLYIGAKDTYSGLHLDVFNTSAWNGVLSGKKLWLFYPPEQAQYLYNGEVNPFKPNFDKYPEFKNAVPIVGVQHPGEVVFTPSGWWHAVYNQEAGVSITENFINDTNYDVVKMTLLYHKRIEEVKIIDECMSNY